MPKYNANAHETTYYLTKVIEAKDENEAEEKYTDMIAMGNVEEVNTDEYVCNVELIDPEKHDLNNIAKIISAEAHEIIQSQINEPLDGDKTEKLSKLFLEEFNKLNGNL